MINKPVPNRDSQVPTAPPQDMHRKTVDPQADGIRARIRSSIHVQYNPSNSALSHRPHIEDPPLNSFPLARDQPINRAPPARHQDVNHARRKIPIHDPDGLRATTGRTRERNRRGHGASSSEYESAQSELREHHLCGE